MKCKAALRLICTVFIFVLGSAIIAHGSPVQAGKVLFIEEFSQYALGDYPAGWTTAGGNPENVGVVKVEQYELGQAVHIRSGGETFRTRVTSPTWELPIDVSKIGIEYKIRMLPGSFTGNVYLMRQGTISYISVHHPGGTRVVSRGQTVGHLKEDEWNHIRVLVDLKNNVYELYVNDMENRVRLDDDKNENYRNGLFDFRAPLETRTSSDSFHIYIDQEGRQDRPSEATYTDFNVWIID